MAIDIEKLALLARIKTSSQEKEKLEKEFEEILGYVSKLKEVSADSQDNRPVRTNDLKNVLREDGLEPNQPNSFSAKLLQEAPATERDYVKVKHIFD